MLQEEPNRFNYALFFSGTRTFNCTYIAPSDMNHEKHDHFLCQQCCASNYLLLHTGVLRQVNPYQVLRIPRAQEGRIFTRLLKH